MAKSKYWKYEADCRRVDTLIAETLEQGGVQPWADSARKILFTARIVRPKATPLALHFVAISAKELLNGRSDCSRLCLNVALAIVNKEAMKWQMQLFCRCFSGEPCASKCPVPGQEEEQHGPPPQLLNLIQHVMGEAAGKIMDLPEGVSELEIAPGMKLHVIKKGLGQGPKPKKAPKTLPPSSRWN